VGGGIGEMEGGGKRSIGISRSKANQSRREGESGSLSEGRERFGGEKYVSCY